MFSNVKPTSEKRKLKARITFSRFFFESSCVLERSWESEVIRACYDNKILSMEVRLPCCQKGKSGECIITVQCFFSVRYREAATSSLKL